MNSLRCKGSWIILLTLGIIIFLASASSTLAASDTSASATSQTDVLILIAPGPQGMDSVSITYPKLLDKSTAEADVKRLTSQTGWTATGESISNEAATSGTRRPMTSVEFVTPHAVDPNSGVFKIEPIIIAFNRLTNVQILYFMPHTFKFHGLTNFENDKVNIVFIQNGDTYSYGAKIKKHDFTALNLPLEGEQPKAPEKHSSRALPIIIIAIIAALFVYLITDRIEKSRRSPSRRS